MRRHWATRFPSGSRASSCETLEPRRLLAATLAGTELQIAGTSKADFISVYRNARDPSQLEVRIRYDVSRFRLSDVNAIRITALGGDDRIFINHASGLIDIPSTIYAGDGDDTVMGGAARDRIYGGAGNDSILAGSGHDIVYGEEGYDSIYGESGNDYLVGGPGNDRIHGNRGNDRLYGEEGKDLLSGDDGDDFLHGGPARDTLLGGPGRDTLEGADGVGGETLTGEVVNGDHDDSVTYELPRVQGTYTGQATRRVLTDWAGYTETMEMELRILQQAGQVLEAEASMRYSGGWRRMSGTVDPAGRIDLRWIGASGSSFLELTSLGIVGTVDGRRLSGSFFMTFTDPTFYKSGSFELTRQ